jgi:hypothetical protein
MFPFANVVDLFANELAGLGRRRFSFALVFPRSLYRSALRHEILREEVSYLPHYPPSGFTICEHCRLTRLNREGALVAALGIVKASPSPGDIRIRQRDHIRSP